MYEVIKLRDLKRKKKKKAQRCFTLCEKCLVRNRREYFTMIEILSGCNVHVIFSRVGLVGVPKRWVCSLLICSQQRDLIYFYPVSYCRPDRGRPQRSAPDAGEVTACHEDLPSDRASRVGRETRLAQCNTSTFRSQISAITLHLH